MKFSSSMIAAASGSVGGLVASRNSFGQYFRRRAVPVNPATERQLTVRDALTAAVNYWTSVLTPEEREAWRVYAGNVPMTDALGMTINLGGQQMFVRSAIAAQLCGLALSTMATAPIVFDLGDFSTPSLAVSVASDGTLTFTTSDEWVGETGSFLMVGMGRPQNPSRSFFGGPFREYVNVAGNSTTPPTSPLVIITAVPPWEFAAGQNFWSRFRVLRADGRLSSARIVGPVLTTA